MSRNLLGKKEKSTNKGLGWMGGVLVGAALMKIPVVGVAVGAFSIFMLFSSVRSEEYKAAKMFEKGMRHFNKEHYSCAYGLLKKAYELDYENPELMRMLVLCNVKLGKDPTEARILVDQITNKCQSHFSKSEIDALREMVVFDLAS